MRLLHGLLWPIERLNGGILAAGRVVATVTLGIMVIIILAQVFWRYVLGAPLNWTEEAARFGMLWMTGLMAPVAYRHGGFVSIDMLERALPRVASSLLTLAILLATLGLLVVMVWVGWDRHVDSMTGNGRSASLRIPLSLIGGEDIRFRNWWMFLSLWVGVVLLTSVTVELILRQLITLFGGRDGLQRLVEGDEDMAGAA